MRLMPQPPDRKRVDRSVQTDARAKPARPDGGIASDASAQHVHEGADGEDGAADARLAVARGRAEPVPRERLAVGLEQAHVVLQRRAVRVVATQRRRRLWAPRRETWRDATTHEVVQALDGGRDRFVDRLEPERPRQLAPRDEVP